MHGALNVDPELKDDLVPLAPVFEILGVLLSYLRVRSGVDPPLVLEPLTLSEVILGPGDLLSEPTLTTILQLTDCN